MMWAPDEDTIVVMVTGFVRLSGAARATQANMRLARPEYLQNRVTGVQTSPTSRYKKYQGRLY